MIRINGVLKVDKFFVQFLIKFVKVSILVVLL